MGEGWARGHRSAAVEKKTGREVRNKGWKGERKKEEGAGRERT